MQKDRVEDNMSNEMMRNEIREAIDAGEQALASLKSAQEKLQSARNWGIADMLGGGLIVDLFKHSKMDDAVTCMEYARKNLKIFQRELKDVKVPMDFRMEISGFLSFADFFFDGIIADYLVQSKIAEAREQVDDAVVRVSSILGELEDLKRTY